MTSATLINLVQQIQDQLVQRQQTLCVAESLTAGRIQSLITAVAGASRFFVGGVTAYHIDQKVALLAVDRSLAEDCNCVSQAVANQMAVGACRLFRGHFALSTTGYAETDLQLGVSQPLAFVSIAAAQNLNGDPAVMYEERLVAEGDRATVQALIAGMAIRRLAEYLEKP